MSNYEYLSTEPYLCRQALAAFYLSSRQDIIEVGCGATPIWQYMDVWHYIRCVDPEIHGDSGSNYVTIKSRIQDYTYEGHDSYAVACLGFEAKLLGEDGCQALYELMLKAKRSVIEYAAAFAPSSRQMADWLSRDELKPVICLRIGISPANEFHHRTLYVLEST